MTPPNITNLDNLSRFVILGGSHPLLSWVVWIVGKRYTYTVGLRREIARLSYPPSEEGGLCWEMPVMKWWGCEARRREGRGRGRRGTHGVDRRAWGHNRSHFLVRGGFSCVAVGVKMVRELSGFRLIFETKYVGRNFFWNFSETEIDSEIFSRKRNKKW